MLHAGWHVVEASGLEFNLVSLTSEDRLADDHGVRLVCRMPMLAHVKTLGGSDQQLGGMRIWIYVQYGNFG